MSQPCDVSWCGCPDFRPQDDDAVCECGHERRFHPEGGLCRPVEDVDFERPSPWVLAYKSALARQREHAEEMVKRMETERD